MEPLTVAITFRIAEDQIARIQAMDPGIEVIYLPEIGSQHAPEGEARARALAEIARAHVAVGPNRMPIEYFDSAIELRWFQSINAGIERMAADGLLRRGFVVTTASGLAAAPIAEYAVGAMIMLAKGLHRSVREQAEHSWNFRFTGGLQGKTLGIVGLGEIGRETARRARGFDMRVVASRRRVEHGSTDPDCHEVVPYSNLGYLLAESDFLLLAVPLTSETRHLIGAPELAQMKPGAFLVNVARGEVIDQDALIAALQEGRIAGAALDVTTPEPLPAESPLWDLPNVIVTAHISGSIQGYGHRAMEMFIANLQRYLQGEPLAHVASPELGY